MMFMMAMLCIELEMVELRMTVAFMV